MKTMVYLFKPISPCLAILLMAILPGILIAQPEIHIIPAPKEITVMDGNFKIGPATTIFVENLKNAETVFAASELASVINSECGFTPVITDKYSKGSVILCLTGRDIKTHKKISSKISIPESPGDEGYFLNVSPTGIVITANTETGIFYGVQSLKQLLRANRIGHSIPCLSITDKPTMRYRGWMDDISRGPIPTVEFVKKEIRLMAEFKLNFFNLYTEHVFRSDKYPDISPTDGFTPAEIKELAEYAARYHIDLMGNFQSFGHQSKTLSNPFYSHLGDNGDILNPADERTYKFLSDIYSEMIPAYRSNFFNINCDETFGLGEGKSKPMADSIGESGIYAYHINRLDKLIKPYGKRLMMWGDIAVNKPEIISRLPKDLIILSWGYHAAESFDYAINPFVKSGFEFMVAPGVSCWGEVWPSLGNAAINISNYCRDGAKQGAIGMMNTAWDDNGHNLFEYNWHGLVWGAECSWNPASPDQGDEANRRREEKLKLFNRNFDAVFFQNNGVIELYFNIDSLRFHEAKGLLSESGFWDDILSFFPSNTNPETESANKKIIAKATKLLSDLQALRITTKRNADNLDYAELALRRVIFAAHKNITRVHVYAASQNNDRQSVSKTRQELQFLVEELHGIKITYLKLWERENRTWWLDKNMGDYNKLANRILNIDKQVYIDPSDEIIDGKRIVGIRTLFNDQTIVYTLDGTDPVVSSKVYTSPFSISSRALIKSSVIANGQTSGITQKMIFLHKGIGNLAKLNSKYSSYNPAYAAGGDLALLDGIKGSDNFADGRWQGYQGQDLDIEIDLKKEIPVRSISMDCYQNSYSWILLPANVSVFSSADGKNYTLIKRIGHSIPMDARGQVKFTFAAEFDNLETRYLKVVAKSSGILPGWHHAAGSESFIFADEIVVE